VRRRGRPGAAVLAGELLDAPDLLLRVMDARLAALAPGLGTDPAAASQAADLLAARPSLLAARALAEAAAAAGHPSSTAPAAGPARWACPPSTATVRPARRGPR
jgi:hypothetical protein